MIILSSILFASANNNSANNNGKNEVAEEDHHHASSSSSTKDKREQVPAEIFSLGEIRSTDAASTVNKLKEELAYTEQCLHAATLNAMSLLYFKKILESRSGNGCPENYDITIYLPRFLTTFFYPSYLRSAENHREELYELSLSIYGNKLLNFELIDHYATVDHEQSCIIYKLDGHTIKRISATQREERIININEKCSLLCKELTAYCVPQILRDFFKANAPILYKEVENLSKYSTGRLGGVALYYDGYTINAALGRKGLAAEGDDPDIHVERELSSKLLSTFAHGRQNTGHLFVYCQYAPCNKVKDSGKIPCLQFYHNLVQENPGLNVTVFFHKPFKTGGDFWSRTPYLTLFDLSTNTQFTEPLPTINLSLLTSGAPTLLERARSDEIVDCLLRIPSKSLPHIVKKIKISDEKRDRIQKKLLEAEAAVKKEKINKKRKMRSRAK